MNNVYLVSSLVRLNIKVDIDLTYTDLFTTPKQISTYCYDIASETRFELIRVFVNYSFLH